MLSPDTNVLPATCPDLTDFEIATARTSRNLGGQPVDLHFFIIESDRSSTMPNVHMQLPKNVGYLP